ncbi:hypothetical protein NQ314_006165 [Rhamnusium bicolor]|uniref:Peptidase S1 domain-containing protein n=1 Tax=Rhamnusium bicolor TaxID=1586634 RepID=A0AAV8Z6S4_9CUCU|nr:hypothetical protein NQ314_006165 [Rhamnusium bicolor]
MQTTSLYELGPQTSHFDFDTGEFDIALLQLSSSVTITNSKPIGLASSRPAVGQNATISGWGRINENDSSLGNEILQVVDVPIVSQEDCQAAYSPFGGISDSMLCAGYLEEGGKDACVGDSGGPLVVDGLLSGIISFGIGCAEPKYPGVYTSVSDLADWIRTHITD